MVLPVVKYVIGGWNLGCLGDLILQGVLLGQFSHYMAVYAKDKWQVKAFVAGLCVITCLKSIQSIIVLWFQNVEYFLDLNAAADMFYAFWPSKINLALAALISFYVQVFFCQRLWAVSNKLWPVAITIVFFVFALIAAFVATSCIFMRQSETLGRWLAIHLSTVLVGDILLTTLTTYFLLQHSKKVLPATVGMLNAIIRLTFQSAAAAAFCALLNLVFSQAGNANDDASVTTMLSVMTNMMLPKLYAISAMWTLNARKSIQLVHSSGTGSSTDGTSNRRTGSKATKRTNGFELGALSGREIQIRTQVQTTQQFDVADDSDFVKDHNKFEESQSNDDRVKFSNV